MKKTGIKLIAEERQRQIDTYGYSDGHISNTPEDYADQSLALAAATYCLPDSSRTYEDGYKCPDTFPWCDEYWKPSPENRIKELTKAGAMIVAEIDRLTNQLTRK